MRQCSQSLWSIEQVSHQYLTRAEERLQEEKEVAEHKATLLDALKTARKCLCQFDTKNNITVLCNKVKNKLYRLRDQGEKKQRLIR
jgi:hypothetical protein